MAAEETRFRDRRPRRSRSPDRSERVEDLKRTYDRHRDRDFDERRDTPRKRRATSRDYDDDGDGDIDHYGGDKFRRPREKGDLKARDRDRDRDRDRHRERRDRRDHTDDFDDDEDNHRHRRHRRDHSHDERTAVAKPRESRPRSHSPELFKRSRGPLPSQKNAFENNELPVSSTKPNIKKEKPNFKNTGLLAAASNTVQKAGQSIVLKYHEPSEARKPPSRERGWRLYVFKGADIVDTVELAEQSCWLFGREAAVVDVLLEHPSTSKQHAVIQFRYIETQNEFGDRKGRVRPYILDLESSNGTTVNDELIPEAQYVELRDKDVIKFGRSSREYVMQLAPQ